MIRVKSIVFLILFGLSTLICYSEHFTVSLWLHSSMFSKNKTEAISELNEKLTFYKEIGVENLYVFKIIKSEHNKGWSFLKYILKIAHKKGLKVHPVITSGYKVSVKGKIKRNSDWLIKDPFGKTLPYLNLSNPDVRKYIQKKVKKLLKYNIDGIHLDYIRFPYLSSREPGDSIVSILIRVIRTVLNYYVPDHIYHGTADNYFSYDKKTLKSFEKYFNKSGDSNTNDEYVLKEWRKWNAGNVTLLVKNIRNTMKRSGKNIPLSAAIISNRGFAFNSLGQDWEKWSKTGVVDVLCPMIYSNDKDWFKERLQEVLLTAKNGCKVYSGIAIESSTNQNTLEGVASQVRIAKKTGADGVVIFSGFSLTEEFGEVIKDEKNKWSTND